ncbi:unnamed protein product [Dicrocoelium dendriticum]|nr:unnamed protein product [Dicrocoelium dendriticum]
MFNTSNANNECLANGASPHQANTLQENILLEARCPKASRPGGHIDSQLDVKPVVSMNAANAAAYGRIYRTPNERRADGQHSPSVSEVRRF